MCESNKVKPSMMNMCMSIPGVCRSAEADLAWLGVGLVAPPTAGVDGGGDGRYRADLLNSENIKYISA